MKKIPGYPRQSLTRSGQLFLDGEPAQTWISPTGYRVAWIYRGRKKLRRPKPIYKLMARTYLGPRPSKKHLVRHLDGNSLNDSVDNLAWGTHKQNMEDLRKHRAERASLTNDLKASIRQDVKKMCDEGIESAEDLIPLTEKHNVAFSTVNRIYHVLLREDNKPS